MHSVATSEIVTPKIFALKISIWVLKTQKLMLISNWCRLKHDAPQKSYSQILCEFGRFSFLFIFRGFLLFTFYGAFLKAGINEFEISIKFCVFNTGCKYYKNMYVTKVMARYSDLKSNKKWSKFIFFMLSLIFYEKFKRVHVKNPFFINTT